MNCTFEEYMADVKSQLDCNAPREYKLTNIVYTYINEQVDSHLEYFKTCYYRGLSGYKALLFFSDIL